MNLTFCARLFLGKDFVFIQYASLYGKVNYVQVA